MVFLGLGCEEGFLDFLLHVQTDLLKILHQCHIQILPDLLHAAKDHLQESVQSETGGHDAIQTKVLAEDEEEARVLEFYLHN